MVNDDVVFIEGESRGRQGIYDSPPGLMAADGGSGLQPSPMIIHCDKGPLRSKHYGR
jgi:hypothetical protein